MYRIRKIVEQKEVGIPPTYGHMLYTLECGHKAERHYSYPATDRGYGQTIKVLDAKTSRCYDCP